MSGGEVCIVFEPAEFVLACRGAARGASPHLAIEQLLRDSLRDPDEVAGAFANNISRSAPIHELMLYVDDDVTIFRVALDPHLTSIPHDHGIWAFVGIYRGEESNTFYQRSPTGTLQKEAQRSIRPGEVLSMRPGTIHAIANPLSSATLGLHVYLGHLGAQKRSMWHPTTFPEEPFDLKRLLEYEDKIRL
jgi:predicted metal-dependent enzyme (double-stranded beta helix superfamily)